MPALILKSIDENKACTFSTALIDDLEQLLACPRDYFSLELLESKFISDGAMLMVIQRSKSLGLIEVKISKIPLHK